MKDGDNVEQCGERRTMESQCRRREEGNNKEGVGGQGGDEVSGDLRGHS